MKQFTIYKSSRAIAIIHAQTIQHAAILASLDRPKFSRDGTHAWQWIETDERHSYIIEVKETIV